VRPLSVLVLLTLLDCTKRSSPSAPSVEAAPPAAASAAADAAPREVDFHRVYQGTIDPKIAIVLRLERRGSRLSGRYFYENQGRDLILDGEVGPDDTFSLSETSEAKVTGGFNGRIEPNGALSGRWEATRSSLRPFSATPLQPTGKSAPARIVRKRLDVNRPFSDPKRAVSGGKRCEVRLQFPELVGVLPAELEDTVNRKLIPELGTAKNPCEDLEYASTRYEVHAAERGIVSVCVWDEWMGLGAAHPGAGVRCSTVTLPSGEMLNSKSLFLPSIRKRIKAAIAKKPSREENDLIAAAFDEQTLDFAVSPKGVLFFAYNALPHVAQALGAEPIVIPYAALKSDLVLPSPLTGFFE